MWSQKKKKSTKFVVVLLSLQTGRKFLSSYEVFSSNKFPNGQHHAPSTTRGKKIEYCSFWRQIIHLSHKEWTIYRSILFKSLLKFTQKQGELLRHSCAKPYRNGHLGWAAPAQGKYSWFITISSFCLQMQPIQIVMAAYTHWSHCRSTEPPTPLKIEGMVANISKNLSLKSNPPQQVRYGIRPVLMIDGPHDITILSPDTEKPPGRPIL